MGMEDEIAGILKSLMVPGTALDAVLTHYKEQVEGTGAGLCHNLAVAIIEDLYERGEAEGWEWCQASVDDGVDHSWVEHEGFCVDMGDNGKLRVRPVANRPFIVCSPITRSNPEETMKWKADWERENSAGS